MMDPAISYGSNGSMTVDTYGMDGSAVGTNDFGEALYDLGGVQMTAEQAEDNAGFFEADDDGYGNSSHDQDETLPESIIYSFSRINDALGGGAADFIADELLGIGDSRMNEVVAGTHMSQDEIQSHATAVMIDLAHNIGMPSDMLAAELQSDITAIRSMKSARATSEMHEVIADAVAGNYHDAMARWDRLRGAMRSIR